LPLDLADLDWQNGRIMSIPAGSILVGDIGGTSSRFALAGPDGPPSALRDTRIYANADHASLSDVIGTYLAETGAAPASAVIDMAGPASGEVLKLTNLDWRFSPRGLTKEFGAPFEIINDFEALACALPWLSPSALQPLGAAPLREDRAKAVLGPGTGLGVGGLVRSRAQWVPVPSEAGHVELAAETAEEFAVFETLRKKFGRVSAEHVLSGPGLERLHLARAAVLGFSAPDAEDIEPADITAAAMSGRDPQALATVRLSLMLLARFAGDVALMFDAEGGVYLYGGVAQKLAPLLDTAAFRSAFEQKKPHEKLLARTATVLITEPAPALVGCAAVALGLID
jgi:glucokinase